MTDKEREEAGKKGEAGEHHCSICGKPSEETICHACRDRIRGEAVEKKRDVDKGKG